MCCDIGVGLIRPVGWCVCMCALHTVSGSLHDLSLFPPPHYFLPPLLPFSLFITHSVHNYLLPTNHEALVQTADVIFYCHSDYMAYSLSHAWIDSDGHASLPMNWGV